MRLAAAGTLAVEVLRCGGRLERVRLAGSGAAGGSSHSRRTSIVSLRSIGGRLVRLAFGFVADFVECTSGSSQETSTSMVCFRTGGGPRRGASGDRFGAAAGGA